MIITIARYYGSGGLEIGQRLAKKLGIPCFNADRMPDGNGDERFEEIRNFAKDGPCVIVGFCADYVLAGTPGLIRVFIHSDMAHRVSRLQQALNCTAEEAERKAMQEDRERARLYGAHTQRIWADLSRYDLAVNSGTLGLVGTAELISQFVALEVMRRRKGKEL